MAITFEIHPSIGIARVGDSIDPAGFFIGPEPNVDPPASYRDPAGRLKRQAARFRVFQCDRNSQNELVSATELLMATTPIEWTVTLANRKGCATKLVGSGRRNGAASNADPALSITPAPKTLKVAGATALLDDGKFRTVPVALGEMRTDTDGRLLVLG